MTHAEYLLKLEQELRGREQTLAWLKPQVSPLDANYRLEQGYASCLAKVIKDLKTLAGEPIEDEFYPDTPGFLDDWEEEEA